MTRSHSLLLALVITSAAWPVIACDLCRVHNAPLAHGIIEQGFHLALSEQFTHYGTLQDESHRVPNEAHQFRAPRHFSPLLQNVSC
jgi:hypothetical protein